MPDHPIPPRITQRWANQTLDLRSPETKTTDRLEGMNARLEQLWADGMTFNAEWKRWAEGMAGALRESQQARAGTERELAAVKRRLDKLIKLLEKQAEPEP